MKQVTFGWQDGFASGAHVTGVSVCVQYKFGNVIVIAPCSTVLNKVLSDMHVPTREDVAHEHVQVFLSDAGRPFDR